MINSTLKPVRCSSGEISAVFEMQRGNPAVFFKNLETGFLNYCWRDKDKWHLDNTSFNDIKVASSNDKNFGAKISAVFENQRSFSAVFFKGEDGFHLFLTKFQLFWQFSAKKKGFLHYYYYHTEEKKFHHDGISFKEAGFVSGSPNHSILFHPKKILNLSFLKGSVSAVFELQRKHSACFFRGVRKKFLFFPPFFEKWLIDWLTTEKKKKQDDQKLHYYYLSPEKTWNHDCISFGTTTGEISSCFETNRQHSAIFFRGVDG